MSVSVHPLISQSLGSGLAGAVALNVLHETVRQLAPDAPRVDVLGKRGIVKGYEAVGAKPPRNEKLYGMALAGDLISNGLYYGLVGLNPKQPLLTGLALGALAGIGAVTLPGPLGLGEKPTERTTATAAMTVGWYVVGGLVAGAIFKRLRL